MKKSRKKTTLIISYAVAAFIVVGGFALRGHYTAQAYKRQIDNVYQHAFAELVTCIGEMDSALQKSLYASSPSMVSASCTEVFGKALVGEARADERIVAITAAMKGGTGLSTFAREFPKRFIDAGIAEEHAVGMASGLAVGGKKPVCAISSTFRQRAIDQMIIDCSLPNLDVVFAIDRAGIVGEDGPTHHGMFDLVYTRMVPNMRVLAPSDEAELVSALHTALALGGPVALRYPRGTALGVPIPDEPETFEPGRAVLRREGDDVAILAFGSMVKRALDAAEELAQAGIQARVVDMRWVKPLDADAIRAAAATGHVVTVEDGVIEGGAGEGVLEELSREGLTPKTLVLGIDDQYVHQGKPDLLMRDLGLDAEGIAASVRALMD